MVLDKREDPTVQFDYYIVVELKKVPSVFSQYSPFTVHSPGELQFNSKVAVHILSPLKNRVDLLQKQKMRLKKDGQRSSNNEILIFSSSL